MQHQEPLVANPRLVLRLAAACLALSLFPGTQVSGQVSDAAGGRLDYLTFAQGALVVSVGGDAEELRVGAVEALEAIDGNSSGYVLTNRPATAESVVELVWELPAATTFDRFAVPEIRETPSPSQTFVRRITILGSSEGSDVGFVELAAAELATHEARGLMTEIPVQEIRPVRWVKARLSGGIQVERDKFFLDFSELIGNGRQERVPLARGFEGIWKDRANVLELKQEGAVVTGCYDRSGDLGGTVSGNILRATGVGRDDGIPSTFVLTVGPDGEIRGVRSSNNGPFRSYVLDVAPSGTVTECSEVEVARLGCGSIIHGIHFEFDSAEIEPESAPVLADLFAGLREASSVTIVVQGHTSSEGDEAYNQKLSERRADAVVADLVRRGLAADRIRAAGFGETRPIASNEDEAGRSLNRRVEIECSEVEG